MHQVSQKNNGQINKNSQKIDTTNTFVVRKAFRKWELVY